MRPSSFGTYLSGTWMVSSRPLVSTSSKIGSASGFAPPTVSPGSKFRAAMTPAKGARMRVFLTAALARSMAAFVRSMVAPAALCWLFRTSAFRLARSRSRLGIPPLRKSLSALVRSFLASS